MRVSSRAARAWGLRVRGYREMGGYPGESSYTYGYDGW